MLRRRFLKTGFAVIGVALFHTAPAATVLHGRIETTYSDFSPPLVSAIDSSSATTIDLSSLTGLIPGADIVVTFRSADPIIWTGGWYAGTGNLTLTYDATLTLTVGGQSAQLHPAWPPLGPVPYEEGPGVTPGYAISPILDSFSLTVPWGTDLSAVQVTLTDRFTMTGTNTGIETSGLSLESFSLTTTSAIPEPTTAALALLSAATLLRRRRE